MYNEVKLAPFVISLVVGGLLAIAAWFIRSPEWLHYVLVFLAAVCALVAFVTGGDYIASRIVHYVGSLANAFYAPKIRVLDIVSRMNDRQLAFATAVEPVAKWRMKLEPTGPAHYLSTPTGDIPMGWVVDYLEKCEKRYPELIPQHGLPDNLERQYVSMFTSMVVYSGLAADAVGNLPARWLFPIETVYGKLGFAE